MVDISFNQNCPDEYIWNLRDSEKALNELSVYFFQDSNNLTKVKVFVKLIHLSRDGEDESSIELSPLFLVKACNLKILYVLCLTTVSLNYRDSIIWEKLSYIGKILSGKGFRFFAWGN